MPTPLRVLVVEDYEPDMFLTVRELKRGGYAPECQRVDTAEDLAEALNREWDLVLSDHSLPTLNAFDVLKMVKAKEPDLPVVIVSGTIGEAAAVEAMRAGASDYVIKSELRRLLPAVERELRETQIRRRRRIVDQALKDSEQRFRDTVGASSDWFWETDAALFVRFLWANGKELRDPRDHPMLGRPLTDIADTLLRAAERPAYLQELLNRRPFHDVVHRWSGVKDTMLIKTAGLPFFDGAGKLLGYRGASIDVTAQENRHAFELQLLHTQRLEGLGTLAGGIAHDLNSLLVPVVGLLPGVARNMPEGSNDRDSVEMALDAGQRASELVKQILLFSRKEEPERTSVDLSALVPQTLKMMKTSAPATIKVDCNVAPVAPVLANAGQIQQVIMNLFSNAVQAIGEQGGHIGISISEEAAGAVLSIADNGPGMTRETLDRIFEPFFTTKDIGKGTGLGLSVVHGIVTAHDGRISVKSAPGDGTRFDIFLPAFKAQNSAGSAIKGTLQ